MFSSLLVTGGAGFIGSNFVHFLLEQGFPGAITVLDKLTYAGNLENLAGLSDQITFVQTDICDMKEVRKILQDRNIDAIVHFAAESHVDRSILGPLVFTQTNVLGTHTLLEGARMHGVSRFIHVSTDEVYGSLGSEGSFSELSPLDPTSPYAASKAASDLIVQAYFKTYGFPAIITRCSNNYGPYQFPEKLIPLMITNAMRDIPLPVYGDGMNVRDWIHTQDHSRAILRVLQKGIPGEVYNVGSNNEWKNIDIVRLVLSVLSKPESLIQFVTDRRAHDRRYSIDSSKIRTELGWTPLIDFLEGIHTTIEWYMENQAWWTRVMNGEYVKFYTQQYSQRI